MENPIAVFMIVGYLVLTTAVGIVMARRVRSAGDWAVAGGGMGMVMVAVGIAGTRIGGVGTYGVAGDVISEGVWNLWYGVNTFLALAIVGFFFAIPYRRLRLQTVGEIFIKRFESARCQRLTSLCVQTEYFIVNILEPFVIGSILKGVIPGLPFAVAVYIGAFILILYTTLGGLWGSSATNMIHCTMILIGLTVVGFVGMNHLGGWEGVTEKVNATLASAGQSETDWWSFTGAGWLAVLGMFFAAAVHTPAASIYVNFSSAAKSEKSLIPAFLLAGVIATAMPFLAGWIGIETLAMYGAEEAQGTASYNRITRLATEINPWVGGIALAAILAAVISSGGPILLSSSTMIVQDWIPFSHKWTPEKKLRAFKITTVIYGIIGATFAWAAPIGSILKLLLFGFAVVVPPAIAVGYLIYWKRTTEAGAFWGIAIGYGTGIVWYGLINLADYIGFTVQDDSGSFARLFHTLFVYKGDGIDPSYPTTFIPLFAVPVISLLTREDTEGKEAFYDTLARAGD